ncbi:GNAT family N-acetyltransferase [Burkholderia singularis]|uniref:GNAT family N-acetyltransferase n=1 Tax=Burkholderia singularis TaxID=1503053 RepID=UPI0009EA8508|nr:GNAT family N-acetyltransferase [Burkholderia singularis]
MEPRLLLPTLETERLWLRPRALTDLDACIAMDRDPDVTRYIAGPWSDPVEHRRFVEHRITRAYPPGLGYWSIFEKARPAQFVGWVLLIPDDSALGRDVEIGWRLVRAAWGRGIAGEAARRVVAHAFGTVRLPRIVADIAAENHASLNVARKLGMRRVSIVREPAYAGGAAPGLAATTREVSYVRHRLERADLAVNDR